MHVLLSRELFLKLKPIICSPLDGENMTALNLSHVLHCWGEHMIGFKFH